MLHQNQRGLQMFQSDFGIPLEVLHLAILIKVRIMEQAAQARIVHQISTGFVIKN